MFLEKNLVGWTENGGAILATIRKRLMALFNPRRGSSALQAETAFTFHVGSVGNYLNISVPEAVTLQLYRLNRASCFSSILFG